jgi:Protein of unknown function (DUF3631)
MPIDWKEEAQKSRDAPSWKEAAEQRVKPTTAEATKAQAELAQTLDDVHDFLGRFVIYPSIEAHDAHVLWIAHTHAMDAWESTPRMAFLSPEPASGKTRALEVSELVVPKPVEAINVSVAYLFRKVGGKGGPPTILFDEIDTVFGPKAKENEETRALLNAGHRRGAVAGRCVMHGKTALTEEIPAYCAVALAGLGWLPDTILSRSVIIRMRRRAPHEKVTPFRRRVYAKEGNKLRDRLAAWAASAVKEMTEARPEMPSGVEDRDADVWESLLAIADAAGGGWPKRAREAAVSLVSDAKEAEPSLGIRLLGDCKTILGEANAIFTHVILKALHEIPEAPWNDLKGKPLNDRGLALRLRQYGIKSKQVRIGETTLKGYERADFIDVWKRYLPPPPYSDRSETSETSETKPDFQGANVSGVSDTSANVSDGVSGDLRGRTARNGDKSNPVSGVSDVSLVGNGRRVEIDPGPIPDCLLRAPSSSFQPPLCDNCGRPATSGQRWDWRGRPDGIVLHSSCEGPWFDSERRQ